MKKQFLFLLIGMLCAVGANGVELKYGLYVHFGMPTFANPGEQGELPAERFAPTAVDTKSWAHTAKEGQMQFAVLTVKHESGFCLWAGKDNDYDIAHSPVKMDIIADFIAACNAEGIAPGADYSIADAHSEGSVHTTGPVAQLYFNVVKKHVTELHSKYPGLRVQIFSRSSRLSPAQWDELIQIVHRLNPQCTVLDWTHPPIYGTQTVNKGWMWSPNDELNTANFLFRTYSGRMRSGAAWMANVGVDRSGQIPKEQLAVLKQLDNLVHGGSTAAPTDDSKPTSKGDSAERLKKLKSLYDQGLINKEDYDRKVKEIVDSL